MALVLRIIFTTSVTEKVKLFFVDALYRKLLFMNVGELSEGFDRG